LALPGITLKVRKEEGAMKKEAVKTVALAFVLSFCLGSFGWAQSLGEVVLEPKEGTKPPLILNAYAVEKGQYGTIWKIYLEAEDPDGDMLRIASVVHQVGYGYYPADFIYLKPKHQKHFKGYIQWNTFSSRTNFLREWTRITLTVSIQDKAGNESKEVVFPFTFESGAKEPKGLNPPAPFDQRDLPKLGNLFIDLFEPTMMGAGIRED